MPVTAGEVARVLDLLRRQRLIRIISLGLMICAVALIPSALLPSFNPATLIAILVVLAGTGGAYLLSRAARIPAAGFAVVGSLALAVAFEVVGKSLRQGGLDVSDLRIYDIFGVAVVLSAVLVSRRGTIVLAACTMIFTAASAILLPKTAAMQGYWSAHYPIPGSAVDAISVALVVQLLVAVVAWLGADSVRRSLLEASRADEVAAANARLGAQAREVEQARRRLQEGIARIQEVHAAVASGNWSARARVSEGELLSLATSLNLLLDRLTRMAGEQGQRARVEYAAHALAEALRRVRAGQPYLPPDYSGTAEDEVLVELSMLLRDLAGGLPVGLLPAQPNPRSLPAGPSLPNPLSNPLSSPASQPLGGGQGWSGGAPPDAQGWPALGDVAPSGGDDPESYLPDWLRGPQR
jgi:hypothetical protein